MDPIKWLVKLLYSKKIELSKRIKSLLDYYKEDKHSSIRVCLSDSDIIDIISFNNSFNKEGKLYFSFYPDFYDFSGSLHRVNTEIIIKKSNKFISFFTRKKYKVKILNCSPHYL